MGREASSHPISTLISGTSNRGTNADTEDMDAYNSRLQNLTVVETGQLNTYGMYSLELQKESLGTLST